MARFALACDLAFPVLGFAADEATLRVAIAGLAHGHVSGFLNSAVKRADARIVAIWDADAALVASYTKRYNLCLA